MLPILNNNGAQSTPPLLPGLATMVALDVLSERLVDDLPWLAPLDVRQVKQLLVARRVHVEASVKGLLARIDWREGGWPPNRCRSFTGSNALTLWCSGVLQCAGLKLWRLLDRQLGYLGVTWPGVDALLRQSWCRSLRRWPGHDVGRVDLGDGAPRLARLQYLLDVFTARHRRVSLQRYGRLQRPCAWVQAVRPGCRQRCPCRTPRPSGWREGRPPRRSPP